MPSIRSGRSYSATGLYSFTNFTWDDPVLEMTPLMPSLA
jgi:hypothetical protein